MTIFSCVSLSPDESARLAGSAESCVNCLSPPGCCCARVFAMLSARASCLASSRRPGHHPATENVRVYMLNCLASLRAGIEYDTVARLVDPGSRSDPVRQHRDLIQQARLRPGQRGQVGVVVFGYDKHMSRRLRADIGERYRAGALQHPRRRRLTRRDAAKEAVGHATILTVPRPRDCRHIWLLYCEPSANRSRARPQQALSVCSGVRDAAIRRRFATVHPSARRCRLGMERTWGRRIVEASRRARNRREKRT